MGLVEAMQAEREERLEDAARLYEQMLQSPGADLHALINLIVLYWQTSELAFYAGQRPPDAFTRQATDRYRELLQEARKAFPEEPTVMFWSEYIASIEKGTGLSAAEALAMRTRTPDYLEPEIVVLEDGQTSLASRLLLHRCKMEGTVRAKYVASVLEEIMSR